MSDTRENPTPEGDADPTDVVEEPAAASKPARTARMPKAEATGAVAAPAEEPAAEAGQAEQAAAQAEPAETPASRPEHVASDFAGREVVYVQAPIPPKLKGNRGVGSALAVLGAAVFALVYAIAMIVAFALRGGGDPLAAFSDFIQNAAFWVPVLVFLVAFVLLVLLVNRAGWAAHVFGSAIVALVVYFGSIGVLLLLGQIVGAASGESGGSFATIASQPFVIIAALAAREVAIWIGFAIAARGRRVRDRNTLIVDEWERENAELRAKYERAGAEA